MIDVTKDITVKVQEGEFIELFIENGRVYLALVCKWHNHVEKRIMNIEQVDALIDALQKAKKNLE